MRRTRLYYWTADHFRNLRDRLGGWIAGHSNRNQRAYIINLSVKDIDRLIAWHQGTYGPSGSWSPKHSRDNERLSVDAVQGGSWMIHAQPYRVVTSKSSTRATKDGQITVTGYA